MVSWRITDVLREGEGRQRVPSIVAPLVLRVPDQLHPAHERRDSVLAHEFSLRRTNDKETLRPGGVESVEAIVDAIDKHGEPKLVLGDKVTRRV